jgi:tetratricopeptide (TPR) repeat protein
MGSVSADNNLTATRDIAPTDRRELSQYEIVMRYNHGVNNQSVLWKIVEPSSGETLTSGEEVAPHSGAADEVTAAALISALAGRFGDATGTLNGLELRKDYPADSLGNICVLRSERSINQFDVAGMVQARACLETTLQNNAGDAEAKATLARLLIAQDELNGTAANTGRALEMANQAVATTPISDRSLAARMAAQYADGQLDAAFSTGNTALAANPLNTDIAAALAARLFVSGSESQGVEIANRIALIPYVHSRDFEFVMALQAYCHGKPKDALHRLDNMVNQDSLVSALRIAALVRMGKKQEAAAALDLAETKVPQFAAVVKSIMKVRRFEPALASMLEIDISLAAKS